MLAAGAAAWVIVGAETLWHPAAISAMVVPPGTTLLVRLTHPLNSRTARLGEGFEARVVSIAAKGAPGIPLGARVEGRCLAVRAGGPEGRPGYLRLTLSGLVDSQGHFFPLETTTVSWWGSRVVELSSQPTAFLYQESSPDRAGPLGIYAGAWKSADVALTPDSVLTFVLLKRAVMTGFATNP
jgi:hypothetical protein